VVNLASLERIRRLTMVFGPYDASFKRYNRAIAHSKHNREQTNEHGHGWERRD
jgi:hypothetical protein